ncbi:MAG: 50S ribosomal protein L3 [Candidatus Doudnabacteria bacterium]|nr:50S ribosomal protein L3 [Candidatus Doudnabacteria bacterium]
MQAVIAKKIGMTQVYQDNGDVVPVTVLAIEELKVAKHLKAGDKVTHIEIATGKKKKPTKSQTGNYKDLGFVPSRKQMIKIVDEAAVADMQIGKEIKADVFAKGDKVDVVGTTKGKGFQGVVKRHGFHGGPSTHGQSDRHRAPGSIGSGTTLGRVFKGTKMGGHMGNVRQTVSNLKVVDVDMDSNTISVLGAVPGANGSFVFVRKAIR